MRPGYGFSTSPSSTSAPTTPVYQSTWHSPVPYLFGGLAAMLGLIALALLILACSYWKLSGYLESAGADDADSGSPEKPEASSKPAPSFVIMAGDEKPTYLATPICSRAASFADQAKGGDEELDEEKAVGGEVTAPDGDRTTIQGVNQ